MSRPNPLEIPEILSLVAYFVPAWKRPQYFDVFIPRDLLSCALVSKSWREQMLPHLWAVYSTHHMAKIPLDVISRYSIYFRHFNQVGDLTYFSVVSPPQWQDPASEQPLFRSTALKSFILTSTSTSTSPPEQLELLRTNPGIVSLQWLEFKPSEVTVPLLNMLLPLAESLKELTLYNFYTEPQAPFALLSIFTNLERLHIGASHCVQYGQLPSKLSLAAFQASAPAGSIQHMSLKQLTVTGILSRPFTVPLMEQIMSRSPKIKHLVMCLREHAKNPHEDDIREQVIQWNTVYRAWIQSLDASTAPNALPVCSTGAHESMPGSAHLGLERLDILRTISTLGKYTWIRSQYERGCQDLVGVSAKFYRDGLALLVPLLQHWKHTVQQVDLDVGAYLGSRTAFSVLSQVLGSLAALKSLRFVAEGGLAKEDSFAIFQGKLGRQDDQGDEDELETTVATTEDISPAWVCQVLESLVIKGVWGTMSKDRLVKGQSAVTLEAASERHHWIAYGSTKFGKQFRVVVSDRIKTLPALRRLILNKTAFDYVERRE
ncbi:hypothetical protein BGZ82_005706 [Podila clonocystis]|nr:hypothetical protein BGZ82_005706 [Podila clonocystis]